MRKVYCFLALASMLFPMNGQSGSVKVPGGTIYRTTTCNSSYKFDHANYSVFIPNNLDEIKGILIHQHGCTMEGHGASTAHDLQYQAFARKWHLAVVGPDLFPRPDSGCGDWINPQEGSGPSLQEGLGNVAKLSRHPELETAPWLLWGQSGGGYWVLAMINEYPDRIIAAVSYSPAFDPDFTYSEIASKIPLIIRHAGAGDFNNPGVNCWGTALHTFSKFRNMDGMAAIAYNRGQNHNYSFLRYITIPFFESALAQRLPQNGSGRLREMDQTKAWFCDTTTNGIPQVYKATTFTGNKRALSWLPDSVCAAKFREYINTGLVHDMTPPPAPVNLKLTQNGDTITNLTWEADADIESGIGHFNIYINDHFFARYPSKGDFQYFDTNGDDAIPVSPPPMAYRISGFKLMPFDKVSLTTVNWFDLESPKAIVFPEYTISK